MKLIKLVYCIALVILVCACNTTSTQNTVSGSYQTNEVAQANINLGIEYLKRGEYENALIKLKKAEKADPRNPSVYNALGLLYQQVNQPEKAEEYFKKSLSLEPANSSTLNNYGLFLCNNNKYEEALEAFQKSANNPLYQTPEVSITNAGTCALNNDKPDLAEGYFRQALERNPKVAPALIQMGEISYDQGNYLSARGYLERYLAIAKHTPKSLWLGIRIEQQLGDKDTLSSYALLLRNNFPDTDEARLLKESGVK